MSIFNLGVSIGLLAAILQIAGYFFYSRKIVIGRVKPNTASWSIWTFGAVLESYSYIVVTGDWVKNLLPAACAVSAVLLFFFCLSRGHFKRLTSFEGLIVFLDCVAIVLWWVYDSASFANIFLVFIAIVSFVPLIIGVWSDPRVEDAFPWYLWTGAYGLLVVVVFIRWDKWEDLVYPAVFLILHLIVAVLSQDNGIFRIRAVKISGQ